MTQSENQYLLSTNSMSNKAAAWLIGLAVLIIAGPGLTVGGLGWSDAPNHAFDGIFILEFMKALPLANPVAWARDFYFHYPTLGILVYYPPGFAIVEAAAFALFGVNIFTARATIMLFAFGAGWLMFRLGRRWFNDDTGLFAALLLITCPHGAYWLNDVMLEWPATFWILAAVLCYERDRAAPRSCWVWGYAACVLIAFLTKQTAGFIAGVTLLHALLQSNRRTYFLRPPLILAGTIAAVAIAVYLYFAGRYAALPAQLLAPSFDLIYYIKHLPEIVGWPLLPVTLLGLATLVVHRRNRAYGLLLLWILAWSGFSICIAAKEPRYFFFALPPMMFAAVRFLMPFHASTATGEPTKKLEPDSSPATIPSSRCVNWNAARPRILLLIAMIIVQGALARTKPNGRLPDYAASVRVVADQPGADLVLVDGVRDGQFIFDLYQYQVENPSVVAHERFPTRSPLIPLRASKVLYARPARVQWGYKQFVKSPEEIVDFLDRYAVRYIVMESALPRTHDLSSDPPPRKWLRELMENDARFKLVAKWPLTCDNPDWDAVELRLYAYPTCPIRQGKTITLPIPAMGGAVTFDLPAGQ